ncbi:hypothetical protein MAR_003922 [Mya arenaria]|uniref:Uncharacterized protein n=1 Tax=Mya arenaria TaxID=6604 RepID=A0ABY7EX33_MYAAR|nr:hypothetical protein MAR_003922 [Mya arenaria]
MIGDILEGKEKSKLVLIKGADVEQVAALLHADLHDNHSLTLLEHLATTIINVMQPKMDQFLMAANILHKRLSGKVVRITEHFNVDEDYRMCDVTELKSVADIQATSEPPQESKKQLKRYLATEYQIECPESSLDPIGKKLEL